MLNLDKIDFINGRYERKFRTALDASEIKNIIVMNKAMFYEAYPKRRVNNLYLDSYSFHNYSNHLAGNAQRLKVRIRWYGETFGKIRCPVLEIKTKNNELGRKISFKLISFVLDEKFNDKTLKNVFEKSNLPKIILEMLKHCRPVLINRYTREYFISRDNKYRVTIDYDLEFFDICKIENPLFKKIRHNVNVVEIKYEKRNDKNVDEITSQFPFRLSANSKYLIGINHFYLD
jgi:SPX domain protein involved in polyphosphate accumulation